MNSNITSIYVGAFLRRARKEKNITGIQLAKLMNMSQQQISRYETGITSITLDKLELFLITLDKRWIDVFKFLEKSFVTERKKENINIYHEI